MSDVAGADLGQLDALASSYQARGAEIAERSRDLDRRVSDAVTTFQSGLSDLRTHAAMANVALLDDIDGLAQTAVATTWTGANRSAFDADLDVLQRGIMATADSLASRIGELEHAGVTPFAEILTQFGRQASGAGDAAEQAGTAMRTRIDGQRTALADAAGTGWTAV